MPPMAPPPNVKLFNLPRLIVWGLFALLLIAAPLLFSEGRSISILSQIGVLMIFALSFNMLLGQGGMLSFGHAVYSGLGAYFAIHAMNMVGEGVFPLPISLIPLVGGVAGMFFGILFGYVTTKKSGTTFAMITLGMVELVFACSLMFPDFFGGEGGINSNRVVGEPVFGISYGPAIEVYYLIAAWLFISTIAMYAFTQTPLGRMINAVRDNPERVGFIGYDAQWIRYLTLILSAFFAGISGGLSAINFELVTAENVSAIRSGGVLLFTFIGGVGFFFGPMIGAIVGVMLSVMLPELTHAWQLYLGLFFIMMVMLAPGGIASILMLNLRIIKHRKLGRIWPRLLVLLLCALVASSGVALSIEMLYHRSLGAGSEEVLRLFGHTVDAASPPAWLLAAGLILIGGWLSRRALPRFQQVWGEVNTDIAQHSGSDGGKA
jgi:branched-chain amino acid transport system permease protein